MLYQNKEAFCVGALLYSPAANQSIANSIIQNSFSNLFSLSLCLEDTIADTKEALQTAENQILLSFQEIWEGLQKKSFYLPKIFIRVREPQQAFRMFEKLKPYHSLLTGFIFPKFSPENARQYLQIIQNINNSSNHKIYMMPIIENPAILSLQHRYELLYDIKDKLDSISELVLNVRVGGNDLCHSFGVRRHKEETIYDILPISHILSDILTVYSLDYIVSGVVWEYFHGEDTSWKQGLERELQLDILNGFVGKTVIHPNQVPIVNESLKICRTDFEDAVSILSWDKDTDLLVSKNPSKERMNEYKTHINWARKIKILSEIYGIKEEK